MTLAATHTTTTNQATETYTTFHVEGILPATETEPEFQVLWKSGYLTQEAAEGAAKRFAKMLRYKGAVVRALAMRFNKVTMRRVG